MKDYFTLEISNHYALCKGNVATKHFFQFLAPRVNREICRLRCQVNNMSTSSSPLVRLFLKSHKPADDSIICNITHSILLRITQDTIHILRHQKDLVGGYRKWPDLLKFSTLFMLT